MSDTDDRYFDTKHLSRDLRRRAARGGALVLAATGLRIGIEGARIIILARLLAPADFGLVAMITAITGVITVFGDLGLDVATVTQEKVTHAQVSTLFWLNTALGLALMGATIAMAPAFAWFYGDPRLLPVAMVVALNFLLGGLSIQHQAVLRRQMRFGILSGIRVLSAAASLVVGSAFALRGAGYWSLVAMTLATSATNVSAVWIAAGWIPGRPVRGSGAHDMVRFGGQLTFAKVIGQLAQRMDQILIGWWWGAAMLGLYSKAYNLVDLPMKRGLVPVNTLVITTLSRLAPGRYRFGYLRLVEKLALVTVPTCVFMLGCGEWLVPFLLGDQWTEAAPMFRALAVMGLLAPLQASNRWLLVTQHRGSELVRWGLAGAVMNVAAVAIGLPWGGIGVAVAVAIASTIRAPLLTLYVTRRGAVRGRDLLEILAAPAVAGACALAALIALTPAAAGRTDTEVVAAGLVVTGAVFLAVLTLLPSGRDALRDTWGTLRLLGGRRPASS